MSAKECKKRLYINRERERERYILSEKRRLPVFTAEKVNRNQLKIYTFLVEAHQRASGVCGHGNSIKLETHFLITKHKVYQEIGDV
jgi:hypothetical protein